MRQELSDVQRRILLCIAAFVREHEMPPTNREIGQEVGIHSTGHIDYHLAQLERKHYLERDARKSRGLRLLPKALTLVELEGEETVAVPVRVGAPLRVPVYGLIAAGIPLEISRQYDDTLDLSSAFAREDVFALRVSGKSMIGDLIDDGDYVIVQSADTAADGECVVATVSGPGSEGEATLKRLYREGNRIRLQPSNPEMEPIFVDPKDVRVQGRVISVVRTL